MAAARSPDELERDRAVETDLVAIGGELERALEQRQRLGRPPLRHQHRAQPVERLGVAGRQLDRAPVGGRPRRSGRARSRSELPRLLRTTASSGSIASARSNSSSRLVGLSLRASRGCRARCGPRVARRRISALPPIRWWPPRCCRWPGARARARNRPANRPASWRTRGGTRAGSRPARRSRGRRARGGRGTPRSRDRSRPAAGAGGRPAPGGRRASPSALPRTRGRARPDRVDRRRSRASRRTRSGSRDSPTRRAWRATRRRARIRRLPAALPRRRLACNDANASANVAVLRSPACSAFVVSPGSASRSNSRGAGAATYLA